MGSDSYDLIRIMLADLNDIQEWRLGDAKAAAAKSYPREYPAAIVDDWGIVFFDVALDARDGSAVCHEVNGPNAVGSDALTGDSSFRAENESRQATRRIEEMGFVGPEGRLNRSIVTIHAHQHWASFRTGGEFYPRVGQFAELMKVAFPADRVTMSGPADILQDEHLSVVMGDVPSVAAGLEVDPATNRLVYQGRPVVFVGNPNIVSELIRTGKTGSRHGIPDGLDLRVFHAGRIIQVIQDKALQQILCTGTGITPIQHFEAFTREEAVQTAQEFLAQTNAAVLKPNGTSGGTGVHVLTGKMEPVEVRGRVDALVEDCVRKYGDNAEAMIFPIRGFEFIRSTGFPMAGSEHLWDLRIAVIFEPGVARVFPVSIRLAPNPFDELTFHLDRDQWISNVSGREVTLLRSGMDDAALGAVGMTSEKLEALFEACLRWTMKAWDFSARGGGNRLSIFEDEAELGDSTFYPSEKFDVSGNDEQSSEVAS